uniref:Mediator complex subunit 9 n=1 Tax=Globodera pallida TaxID=36090 RepID=A0A183C700_GLOPA
MSSIDGAAGGSAAGGGGAGPSSVEQVVLPVEQLMADVAEGCPPTLDQRLQSMDTVDRRIDDMLTVVAEVLISLDKDKPLSKAKMEELYKKYEQRLGEIQRGITEQLTYM